jgi:hypothetical protein
VYTVRRGSYKDIRSHRIDGANGRSTATIDGSLSWAGALVCERGQIWAGAYYGKCKHNLDSILQCFREGRVGICMRKCQTPRLAFLRERNHKSRYFIDTNLGSELRVDNGLAPAGTPFTLSDRRTIDMGYDAGGGGVSTGAGSNCSPTLNQGKSESGRVKWKK